MNSIVLYLSFLSYTSIMQKLIILITMDSPDHKIGTSKRLPLSWSFHEKFPKQETLFSCRIGHKLIYGDIESIWGNL